MVMDMQALDGWQLRGCALCDDFFTAVLVLCIQLCKTPGGIFGIAILEVLFFDILDNVVVLLLAVLLLRDRLHRGVVMVLMNLSINGPGEILFHKSAHTDLARMSLVMKTCTMFCSRHELVSDRWGHRLVNSGIMMAIASQKRLDRMSCLFHGDADYRVRVL